MYRGGEHREIHVRQISGVTHPAVDDQPGPTASAEGSGKQVTKEVSIGFGRARGHHYVATDDHGIFVTENSEIDEFADIEGKSFAVNNLQNIGTVSVYAQLEEPGMSPDSVDLTEMPNPDMAPAVANGNVDVIWHVEPFQTIAAQSGLKRIDDMFAGPAADMPVGGWVTSKEFAENNPEVIASFREALTKYAQDLQDNHDLHMELVPQYTEIDDAVAQNLTLPHYDTELNVDAFQNGPI